MSENGIGILGAWAVVELALWSIASMMSKEGNLNAGIYEWCSPSGLLISIGGLVSFGFKEKGAAFRKNWYRKGRTKAG